MDLQVSQDYGYYNYTNNYDVVVYAVIFAISICAFTAFDYINLKKDVKNEMLQNDKIFREFEKYRKHVDHLETNILDLETNILDLGEKIKNINKNINLALDQNLDYVNRQLLIQNSSIEEVNSKVICETEEMRSELSRNIYDLKNSFKEELEELRVTLFSEVEELEEGRSSIADKVDEVCLNLTAKLDEKMQFDKDLLHDMHRYLYFGSMNGRIADTVQGFFKQFYGFDYETNMSAITNKMLEKTHPLHNMPLVPGT